MQDGQMLRQRGSSQLSAENAAYVEALYEQYLVAPQTIPEDWRTYFEKLPRVADVSQDTPHQGVREQFLLLAKNSSRSQPMAVSRVSTDHERRQVAVLQLIAGYRNRGHQRGLAVIVPARRQPQPVAAARLRAIGGNHQRHTRISR